jgi:hypothetical protein
MEPQADAGDQAERHGPHGSLLVMPATFFTTLPPEPQSFRREHDRHRGRVARRRSDAAAAGGLPARRPNSRIAGRVASQHLAGLASRSFSAESRMPPRRSR